MDESTVRKSSDIAELAKKVAAIAAEIGEVPHDSRNQEQGYGYTSFDQMAAKLRKPLAERNVAIFFEEVGITTSRTWEAGKFNKTWTCIRVTYDATIVDGDSGQWISILCSGEGADPADKALPKAQTMAMKYLLKSLFRISTGKDDAEADPATDRAVSEPDPVITDKQHADMLCLMEEVKARPEDFCRYFGITEVGVLPAKHFERAIKMLEAKRRARSREPGEDG